MKIAFVLPGGVDRTGVDRVIPCLLWLIERLVAGGDELHVFALNQEPRPGRWKLLGAEIHNIGTRPRQLRTFARLAAEHRRGRFDIVHAFWANGPGVISAAFGRLTGIPSVLTLPGGDLVALKDIGYGGRLTVGGRVWTKLALAGAERVIVQSEWGADLAAALGISAVQIPFGVATDQWPVLQPRQRDPGAPLRLIHAASLNLVKDQQTLLRAMRFLRERGVAFRLDVIGEDTMNGVIQRQCVALGLDDAVVFHGVMPHAQQREWFEQADMMVISSRHEGGPLVTQEAAVAGVPTVGTAVGHIADWAPDGAVGVPVGNPEALAGAIARLAWDEEGRLRLARAAQAAALKVDADGTAERTRQLYAELLEARRSA